jgi:hypothetical protein
MFLGVSLGNRPFSAACETQFLSFRLLGTAEAVPFQNRIYRILKCDSLGEGIHGPNGTLYSLHILSFQRKRRTGQWKAGCSIQAAHRNVSVNREAQLEDLNQ